MLLQKFAPGILLLLLIEALNKEDTAEFGVEFAQEALNGLHNYRFAFIIFVHVDLGDFNNINVRIKVILVVPRDASLVSTSSF